MADKPEKDIISPEAPPLGPVKPADVGEAMEIVLEYAGSMGRYQRFLFLGMLPFGFTMAFVNYVTLFAIATPDSHWCHVPELEHLDLELRRNLSAPGAITSGGDWELWDRCTTFDIDWSSVLETMEPPHPDTPRTETCPNGWVFQYEDIPYETVVTERGWVCDQGSYVPTVQWGFFAGAFAGGLLFGWIADRFGRVPALVATNMVGFVGTVACIFTNSVWDIAVTRFVVGMCYDNCFMLFYILTLEYVGAKYRTWFANLSIMLYFGGGCMVLPWLAVWLANWKTLILVTSVPMVFALAAPFLIPESARWLSSKGKNDKAVKMLRRLERVNGKKIPQEAMDDFVALSISSHKVDGDESLKAVIIHHPKIRILLILLVVLYAACALVFDGIVRLSGSLGMNMFIFFTISSATEFPSLFIVIFLLDKIGRRAMTAGSSALVAVLSLVAAFVDRGTARAVLTIGARFFVNMSFNTTIQWVAELLPSGSRGAGSSIVHVTAFLLASLSPYIVYMERIWSGLPFVIIGTVALAAALLSAILPETMGEPMPHNCSDAERLIEQSLLGKMLCSSKAKKEEDSKDS